MTFIGNGRVFDRYASLGRDCEVGFQFKRILGRQESGFFNWNYTNPEPLLSLLSSDFSGILEESNLSLHAGGSMIRDASHDFFVHHEFDINLFNAASDFSEKLNKLRAKFRHFINDFKNSADSANLTAYFLKYEDSSAREFALKVQTELKRYHKLNPFAVIVLQTSDREETDWCLPGIHNRYLKRFAPYDDTLDAHVASWNNIFREFPHKSQMQFTNY